MALKMGWLAWRGDGDVKGHEAVRSFRHQRTRVVFLEHYGEVVPIAARHSGDHGRGRRC